MKIDPRKIAIDSGWLVYETDSCTCDGDNDVTSSHRPGCGLEPIITIDQLLPIIGIQIVDATRKHELAIRLGWLVHEHGEHDCDYGDGSITSQHHPTCGKTPIITVKQLAEKLVAYGAVS